MASIKVVVKHQGKKYDVELDPSSSGETFKYQVYSLTGVEPDRQKILVKGGQLKDDALLSSIGAKAGQVFMMMGTAAGNQVSLGEPKEKIRFLEDMTDAEAAQSEGATPAGLQNLGNTCYMNATIQVLRAVPELQEALVTYKSSGAAANGIDLSQFGLLDSATSSVDLTGSLRDLYKQMSQTQENFPPLMFLNALQTVHPQFAERSRTGHGYAQQDAEEAWSIILEHIRPKLKITKAIAAEGSDSQTFVETYMTGTKTSKRTLTEANVAADLEAADESVAKFLKLDCHISITTNHLREGILAGLSEKMTKHSSTLDRDAEYTIESRLSALPKYLTVHFVRFFWRRDINKKTKIMRKVTFPTELDATEFCSDTLKSKLVPVRDKMREIRKEETDMERARKRQKIAHQRAQDAVDSVDVSVKGSATSVTATGASAATKGSTTATKAVSEPEPESYKTDAEYEMEKAASLLKAKRQLYETIDPDLLRQTGTNQSGLYELVGVVTHQGASADGGHYTAYVKKSASRRAGGEGKAGRIQTEDDEKWWWFNDDKVSEVGGEKIEGLAGGGESHSALILLYRAPDLPTAEEVREK